MKRICIVPQVSGVGGMVSFRAKFTAGLLARGIQVSSDLEARDYDAVLVIGGTRQLASLRRARRRGVPVIQRLNGMNWIQRRRRTGWRHFLRAETGNQLLQWIRSRLATGIVYQSEFAWQWWERIFGPAPVPHRVVYNAVDLATYNPQAAAAGVPTYQRPADHYRLLLVEGSLMGGYESGLETAVALAELLNSQHRPALAGKPVELLVAGRVAETLLQSWAQRTTVPITWAGLVPPEDIPALDRSAHLLYAADINAACPNSVVEALACGLPVLAFATGALPELVTEQAGRVVPYGGDPWRLDPPDVPALARAGVELLTRQAAYRAGARQRAEAALGLDQMVAGYLAALSGEA
ncbi:MAG: glycosyltransferase family 4 protein [Anaerolineales bacterium]|nr:glycosyltransferase family 4 protein [Anaerolineales bacterium]